MGSVVGVPHPQQPPSLRAQLHEAKLKAWTGLVRQRLEGNPFATSVTFKEGVDFNADDVPWLYTHLTEHLGVERLDVQWEPPTPDVTDTTPVPHRTFRVSLE